MCGRVFDTTYSTLEVTNVCNILVQVSACRIRFDIPGRRRMDRTDRIDLTVEDMIMRTGWRRFGICCSKFEKEHQSKFDTNQQSRYAYQHVCDNVRENLSSQINFDRLC